MKEVIDKFSELTQRTLILFHLTGTDRYHEQLESHALNFPPLVSSTGSEGVPGK